MSIQYSWINVCYGIFRYFYITFSWKYYYNQKMFFYENMEIMILFLVKISTKFNYAILNKYNRYRFNNF